MLRPTTLSPRASPIARSPRRSPPPPLFSSLLFSSLLSQAVGFLGICDHEVRSVLDEVATRLKACADEDEPFSQLNHLFDALDRAIGNTADDATACRLVAPLLRALGACDAGDDEATASAVEREAGTHEPLMGEVCVCAARAAARDEISSSNHRAGGREGVCDASSLRRCSICGTRGGPVADGR
jgi:hypothetical protein